MRQTYSHTLKGKECEWKSSAEGRGRDSDMKRERDGKRGEDKAVGKLVF